MKAEASTTPIVATPSVQEIIISAAKQASTSPKIALAVSKAESGLNPKAYNPEPHYDRFGNVICRGSYGLFQIGCVNYKGDPKDLFDPKLNAKIAMKMHQEQGWHPWSVCRTLVKCYEDTI